MSRTTKLWRCDCSNMAGFDWTWYFYLDFDEGELSLRSRQRISDRGEGPGVFDPDPIEAPKGIRIERTGAAFLRALVRLADEAGVDNELPDELPRIVRKVKARYPRLAADIVAELQRRRAPKPG